RTGLQECDQEGRQPAQVQVGDGRQPAVHRLPPAEDREPAVRAPIEEANQELLVLKRTPAPPKRPPRCTESSRAAASPPRRRRPSDPLAARSPARGLRGTRGGAGQSTEPGRGAVHGRAALVAWPGPGPAARVWPHVVPARLPRTAGHAAPSPPRAHVCVVQEAVSACPACGSGRARVPPASGCAMG
ncbi:unnamed protein product, partial [Prorocentrum cordatum]